MYYNIKAYNSVGNNINPFAVLVKKNGVLKSGLSLFQNSSYFNWIEKIKNMPEKTLYLMNIVTIDEWLESDMGKKSIDIKLMDKYYYQILTKDKVIESGIKENLYVNYGQADTIYNKQEEMLDLLKVEYSKKIKDVKFNVRSYRETKGYLIPYMEMNYLGFDYDNENILEGMRIFFPKDEIIEEGLTENLLG